MFYVQDGREFNILEHDVTFGVNNSICGPCHVTIDRLMETTADAIMVKTGHLLKWQKVRQLSRQNRKIYFNSILEPVNPYLVFFRQGTTHEKRNIKIKGSRKLYPRYKTAIRVNSGFFKTLKRLLFGVSNPC